MGLYEKIIKAFGNHGKKVESIFVADLPADDLISANYLSTAIQVANEKVRKADIVVVLTPVYKASYSGILKTYLDLLPQKALVHKAVIPVAIGGTFGHLLAIDYAIKPVLSALGATTIFTGAFVIDQDIKRTNVGFELPKEIDQRITTEVERALAVDQLGILTD